MPKAVEFTPYQIFDRTGKLVMTSDERCRYSPSEELSLIEAGHTIRLGKQKITKAHVLRMMKEAE